MYRLSSETPQARPCGLNQKNNIHVKQPVRHPCLSLKNVSLSETSPCFGYSLAHLHLNYCLFDLALLMDMEKAKSEQKLAHFWTKVCRPSNEGVGILSL